MNYLITGRAGSGKSAVNKELQARGFNSLDADKVPGLARWEDTHTGRPVQIDPTQYVDYSKVDWNWQEAILKGLISSDKPFFLYGSASNELEFHHLFDKVFVLTLDPKTQTQRLKSRPDAYGKHPYQQPEIIEDQAEFAAEAIRLGAIDIDNTRPLRKVVDDILSQTNEG